MFLYTVWVAGAAEPLTFQHADEDLWASYSQWVRQEDGTGRKTNGFVFEAEGSVTALNFGQVARMTVRRLPGSVTRDTERAFAPGPHVIRKAGAGLADQ